MKLSILIPTISKRSSMLSVLLDELSRQKGHYEIEVILDRTEGVATGIKRNTLLKEATGEYVCFIDDDDAVSHRYLELIFAGIASNPDCLSLVGEMTTNGSNPHRFIHSLKYNSYFEKDGVYYRPPNHLNVIRTDIAKRFEFPAKTFGEDTDWAMQICNARVLKTQVEIDEVLYYYKYVSNK